MKAHEKIDQNNTVQKVALDMKQMVDVHKKLTDGWPAELLIIIFCKVESSKL